MEGIPERSESVDTRELYRKKLIQLMVIVGVVLVCFVNIWLGVGDQVYWRSIMKSAVSKAITTTNQTEIVQ